MPDNLTADDLNAARQHSTGRVLHLVCPPCTGDCNQGRRCHANTPAEACTELGAESMLRHRRMAAHAKAIAMALLVAVAGYLTHIYWPLA